MGTTVNKIYKYDETDEASPASTTLNKLGNSVRTTTPYVTTATTAADGTFSGTFPAGRFTGVPTVIATVQSGTYAAAASALASSPTAFSGKCVYYSGEAWAVTNGFVVVIEAYDPGAIG